MNAEMGKLCCGGTKPQLLIGCDEPDKKDLPEWVIGWVSTPAGEAFRVSCDWRKADYWGAVRSRISAFRMQYRVDPGLYAVGEPGPESDVLVSANYKLSFDVLRRSLKGMDAWILVLDTRGINVWCAAGKGTFGTGELIHRVQRERLEEVVSHRRLILPQLGAPGIHAHLVKEETGFRVFYGPVRAGDIPAYIRAGYRAVPEMRRVRFGFLDRLVLTPMEINPVLKKAHVYVLAVLVVFGLSPSGVLFRNAWSGGEPFLLLGLIAGIAGTFLTPVFLPLIPFRSFAVKGWIAGFLSILACLPLLRSVAGRSPWLAAFALVFFPALSSYLALQFTGSTPYTGRSGVEKELKIAVPIYLAVAVASGILLVVYKLSDWGMI